MIREKIDVYTSFLEDVPMQFIVDGLTEDAWEMPRAGSPRTRTDFVRDTIIWTSVITDFQEQASIGLIEGIQM